MATMKKKLLSRTLSSFALFSLAVLLISAPLFYFLITRLFSEEADETLLLQKNEFVKYSAPHLEEQNIIQWNRFNRNVRISEPGWRLLSPVLRARGWVHPTPHR